MIVDPKCEKMLVDPECGMIIKDEDLEQVAGGGIGYYNGEAFNEKDLFDFPSWSNYIYSIKNLRKECCDLYEYSYDESTHMISNGKLYTANELYSSLLAFYTRSTRTIANPEALV